MSASLLQQQRDVQGFLLKPADGVFAAVKNLVKGSTQAPQELRLAVYAEAYRLRLQEALAVDYAGLKNYLGDEHFSELAHAYIKQYPSRHFSLRWFGAQLANFIAATAPYSEHPDLVDFANFEWVQCHAFDAANATPIEMAALASLSGERWFELQLQLHPSVQVVTLHSNAPAIWSALSEEIDPPALELFSQPKTCLVWRQDLRILFRELSAPEAYALVQFAANKMFADVCDGLVAYMPETEIPGYAAGLLRRWIEAGLITAIKFSVDEL